MKKLKVVFYCLNNPNVWEIDKALRKREITDIQHFCVIPDMPADPEVDFLVTIFDQQFKDYDLEHFTNGKPDWREDVAFDAISREIQMLHQCFPHAKIFLIDCTSMSVDDLMELGAKGCSDEVYALHEAQYEREKKVWKRLREKFFKEDFCITEEFRLTSSHQKPLADKITDIIVESRDDASLIR